MKHGATISYPYLPVGRQFLFVSETDPFMQEAKRARDECAGDPIFPIGAVLVKEGRVIARAGNGFNKGSSVKHICPRFMIGAKSGERYDLCQLHDPPGHAEPMVIKAATDAGEDPAGSDMYLYGHWWCCESCWNAMIAAGIRNVYLVEKADELFTHQNVHAVTLKSSVRNVYISDQLAGLRSTLCEAVESVGCVCSEKEGAEVLILGAQEKYGEVTDKLIVRISPYQRGGLSDAVYHIVYENEEHACDQLQRVLRQL